MTAEEIKMGICNSSCKMDLKSFLDRVDVAINSDQCDFDEHEWEKISEIAKNVVGQFNLRVYH